MLGHHVGYRTLTAQHARAARAARLRPPGLAHLLTSVCSCPLLLSCSCCITGAHPAATAVAVTAAATAATAAAAAAVAALRSASCQ